MALKKRWSIVAQQRRWRPALFLSEKRAHYDGNLARRLGKNRRAEGRRMKHWVRSPLEREIAEGRLRGSCTRIR